jgi:tetratricopeptide (TPR) repeat protein
MNTSFFGGRRFVGSVLGILLLLAGCSQQSKKEKLEQQAERSFDKGELARAKIEFLNLLRLDPENRRAIERLAYIFLDEGEAGPAFLLLTKAKRLDPTNLVVRQKLSALLLMAGQAEKAFADARFILEQSPADPEAALLCAMSATSSEDLKWIREHTEKQIVTQPRESRLFVAIGTLELRQARLDKAESAFRRAREIDPKSSKVHLALGNVYWLMGDETQADEFFRQAAALSQGNSIEKLKWASFKLKSGGVNDARKILGEMLHQDADFVPALAYLAQIELADGRKKECAAIIEHILRLDADNFSALLLKARLSLAESQTAEAISQLKKISQTYSREPSVHFYLALAYMRGGDLARARASVDQALLARPHFSDASVLRAEIDLRRGDLASAIPALKQVLRENPRAWNAYPLLTAGLQAQGDWQNAELTARNWIKQKPQDPEARLVLGMILRNQKKLADATAAFEEVVRIQPDLILAADQLVDLDLLAKNTNAAGLRVQQLLGAHPDWATVRFLEAKFHLALNQPVEAEQALKAAIACDAQFQPAYRALAQIHVQSGKTGEAIDHLSRLVENQPNNTGALMQLASIHERIGEFAKARARYEQILSVDPRSTAALNNLAYLLCEKVGDLEAAYELAVRARKLAPQDPYLADTLGWIVFKRGDYNWAVSLLRESAQKLPGEPDVLSHLGLAYYRMGEEKFARDYLNRAMRSTRSPSEPKLIEAHLAVLELDPTGLGHEQFKQQLLHRTATESKDVIAWLRLARHAETTTHWSDARQFYEQARTANPKSFPAIVGLARLLGHAFSDSTQGAELLRTVRPLTEGDPDRACILAQAALDLGDVSTALSLSREVLQNQPRRAEAHYVYGWALFMTGQLEQAVSVMTGLQDAALTPNEKWAVAEFIPLARAYLQGGPWTEAIGGARRALEKEPRFIPALLVLAVAAEQQKQLDDAKAHLEKILANNPGCALAAKHLALIHFEKGDHETALQWCAHALPLMPEDAPLLRLQSRLAFAQRDYQTAIRFLNRSLAKEPNDSDAWFELGLSQYHLNQRSECKLALNRGLKLQSNSALAAEARKILEQLP